MPEKKRVYVAPGLAVQLRDLEEVVDLQLSTHDPERGPVEVLVTSDLMTVEDAARFMETTTVIFVAQGQLIVDKELRRQLGQFRNIRVLDHPVPLVEKVWETIEQL